MVITRNSTGTVYEFLLAATAEDGRSIQFSWNATQEIERHQKHFSDLINAALNYLFPVIVERIEARLKGGLSVRIGPCKLTRTGIAYETKGWFSNSACFVPWQRVRISIENGDVIVSDAQSRKSVITFPFLATKNAPVLNYLANANRNQE